MIRKLLLIPAALLLITACGGNQEDTVTPTPAPTVTETVTAPPQTVEKVIDKPVASPACLQALKDADALLDTQQQALEAAGRGFQAIVDEDVDAINAMTEEVSALSDRAAVESDAYDATAKECRATGA